MSTALFNKLSNYYEAYHPVVFFDKEKDKLLHLNLTSENTTLTESILNNTTVFSKYIEDWLQASKAKFGIGGYNEHRTIYSRSNVFSDVDEPRRLHLGIDIWGPAGTPVFSPLDGEVHSVGFNNNFGDYGATIILKHYLDGTWFYTLFGHLSKADIENVVAGEKIEKGKEFAHFGPPEENGFWPPHLHFQIIENIGDWVGDYPGVCKYSERELYLNNSPNPDAILGLMQFAKSQ